MPELTSATVASLPSSGPSDPIEYYRRPIVGRLYLERINMGLRMLGEERFERTLEIGYGAGAVLLSVAGSGGELHGIDYDANPAEVARVLSQRGCTAQLKSGDARSLPYEDSFFDLVLSYSVFEHLHEYRTALKEVARVLRPRGTFLLGMPAVSKAMTLAFHAIGFHGIDDHHVTSPADVARSFFDCGLRRVDARYLGPRWAPLYSVWRLTKAAAA
jgi:cyclopropane fatty-acyl-phospholipid synthase-like methyltransferase